MALEDWSVLLIFAVSVMLLLVKWRFAKQKKQVSLGMSSSLSKKYETHRMMLCNFTIFSQLSYWMIEVYLRNTSSCLVFWCNQEKSLLEHHRLVSNNAFLSELLLKLKCLYLLLCWSYCNIMFFKQQITGCTDQFFFKNSKSKREVLSIQIWN